MEKRKLGKTGLDVSLLGFGCGAVGGLMTKGAAADQERAVARALELGINYFDTAQMYGNGESERNLGRVLKALKPNVYVGTKVRLPPTERGQIGQAIAASLEASLKRLQRDWSICSSSTTRSSARPRAPNFGADAVLDEVVPAFERLRDQGKFRFFGITANGETAALAPGHRCARLRYRAGQLQSVEPEPGQRRCRRVSRRRITAICSAMPRRPDMGIINIRVLAGGALSGTEERHPLGSPPPAPIGSGCRLPPRCRARAALRAAGARRPCRQPDRSLAALCDRASGGLDRAGRLSRRWSISNMPRARSRRARCRRPRSPASPRSSAVLPASRARGCRGARYR